jgi:hypothetical protein
MSNVKIRKKLIKDIEYCFKDILFNENNIMSNQNIVNFKSLIADKMHQRKLIFYHFIPLFFIKFRLKNSHLHLSEILFSEYPFGEFLYLSTLNPLKLSI